jgi:hypothetical protein
MSPALQTQAAPAAMQHFRIRIRTASETALQDCLVRNDDQAWDLAFNLCESLLGDLPPKCISVRPVLQGGAA